MKEKVVLAYSGGLDTTAIIPWLKETYGYEVVCCCINCGQGEELDGLEERAKLSGASKLYIEDITDEFCDDYIVPCVQAGAVYEHKYLLGTAMARPGIAKKLVEIARKENAVAICHGATGKGNDQSVSSLVSKHLLRISKSLLLGVMTSGRWIPVRQRSHTAKHTESIFHSAQTKVTAVTVTYGISAMKDLSWKILQTSQIMIIFWFLVFPLRKLRTKANM